MEITISGRQVFIDEADSKILSTHWLTIKQVGYVYVMQKQRAIPGSRNWILFHRLLLGAAKGQLVDHANGNKLDNRRENLRVCTYSQNMANSKSRNGRTKGVWFCPSSGRFHAYIKINYRRVFLGSYPTEPQAQEAYNIAAKAGFREFAKGV